MHIWLVPFRDRLLGADCSKNGQVKGSSIRIQEGLSSDALDSIASVSVEIPQQVIGSSVELVVGSAAAVGALDNVSLCELICPDRN